MQTRRLQNGTLVEELVSPKTLTVYTKCPEKWMLTDMETGEVYTGHITDSNLNWKKVINNAQSPTN